MSRYFNSFMDNSSEALEHSWGTSPRAKAREKEYNHWYYQKHKDEFAAVRKQRNAAKDSYRQAEKYRKDAERYWSQSNQMYDRYFENPETLKESNVYDPYKSYEKYIDMYYESKKKSMDLKYQANRQKSLAEAEDKRIRRGIKNPTVRDLVEFYLDTKFDEKTAKAVSAFEKVAKKYAPKTVSTFEKAAKKYAPKTVSTFEKAVKKYVKE